MYPYNSYDGSNVIRLTWRGNQVEDCATKNFLECHQYSNYARIVNIRLLVSVIIYTLLGDSSCLKVQIQPDVASESTDGEIRCIYKYVKKTMAIRIFIEELALHTGAPTVNLEDNTSCISIVEAKMGTSGVTYIYIPVCFSTRTFSK